MAKPAPTAILETVLYVSDLKAAEAFYSDVLGFNLLAKAGDRQIFYRCGQQMLLIFNPEETKKPPARDVQIPVPPHGAIGAGHICFAATASEIDQWKKRLVDAGVEIEADFHWPNGGRSLYFRDPHNNSLEFAEPRIWGIKNGP